LSVRSHNLARKFKATRTLPLHPMPTEEKQGRAYWQHTALAGLPPEEDVIARNQAITGKYATWYTLRPDALKWAGMAAFASHRVGLALQPYRITFLNSAITDIEADETYTDSSPKALLHHRFHLLNNHKESVLHGLNLLRETNNRIFEDIGWTHVAYLSPEGGLAALEAELAGQPKSARTLEGFRLLDHGCRMLAGPSQRTREAQKLIWKGNELLLRHEQFSIAQNQFDQLDPAFDLFLSFATVMSFEASYFHIDPREMTSFRLFMWLFGFPLLARTRCRPNIAHVDHRWYWIRHRMLPLWKRVEAQDKTLPEKMEKLKGGARL